MGMIFNSNYCLPQFCSGRILIVSKLSPSLQELQSHTKKSAASVNLQTSNWNSQEFQCLILAGTFLPHSGGHACGFAPHIVDFQASKVLITEPLWKQGQAERGASSFLLNSIIYILCKNWENVLSFNGAPLNLWIFAVLLKVLPF